jgi:hypothetical protein
MNARCLSIAICGMLFATLSTSAQKADNSKIVNGHKFVDLALPSGLLWAETNIGAETETDFGSYFAWGETQTKDSFNRETYKYEWLNEEYGEWYNKYCPADEVTTLLKEDDAASANWGSSCRMPTTANIDELCDEDNCTWEWTCRASSTRSKVYGYKVTSKKNGNWIFLPATGYYVDDLNYDIGKYGRYWSSNVEESDGEYAYFLGFTNSSRGKGDPKERVYGCSVRAVAESNAKGNKSRKAASAAAPKPTGSTVIDGHKFIDLALPSRLLWAECNIGAASPTDVGTFFAWGETHMRQKESFDWESYKYGTTEENMTKYNDKDGKSMLDSEDDAATVNWGSSCRMPDCDDFRELLEPENCTLSWMDMTSTTGASVKVCKVTSVRNGNSILLPACCNYIGKEENCGYISEFTCFWTRNADNFIGVPAFFNWIGEGESGRDRADRCEGFPIRPVAKPTTFIL